MPDGVKKGITVKVDAGLHAEVSAYIREHGMTMSEFVALAKHKNRCISGARGNVSAYQGLPAAQQHDTEAVPAWSHRA